MQNRYINTVFYLLVISFVVLCSVGALYRFKADIYFDIARNQVVDYATKNEYQKLNWAYWKAIEMNPLEFVNYANILNGNYIRLIQEDYERRKIQDVPDVLP